MRYDRDAAVTYARRFWDRPCDDGIFWRTDYAVDVAGMRKSLHAPAKDGWEARFVPDGAGAEHAVFKRDVGGTVDEIEIQPWDGLADCAHFLSRCLTAGGFVVKEISVPKLVNHLKVRGDTKVLAERVTRERGQAIVDSGILKKGDMLGYFNISSEGDYGGRRQYSHSTMFIGKIRSGDVGRITCHTKSRFGGLSAFPDQWHLDDDSYLYTFIHISRDDVLPPSMGRTGLQGWWQSDDHGGRYYYLSPTGHASIGMRAPRSVHDRPGAVALNSGHYFVDGGRLTLIWRLTGEVDAWNRNGDDAFLSRTGIGQRITRWTERGRRPPYQ
jgi:hypothetical protein